MKKLIHDQNFNKKAIAKEKKLKIIANLLDFYKKMLYICINKINKQLIKDIVEWIKG